MNLKLLALLVFIAQVAQLGLFIYYAIADHYFSFRFALQFTLSVPLILFFFYVWKRQKA
jgi:hypothetical protein